MSVARGQVSRGTDIDVIENCPVFDLLFSLLLLAVTLPLLAAAALLVRIDSRGPAIFKQKRVGASKLFCFFHSFLDFRYIFVYILKHLMEKSTRFSK